MKELKKYYLHNKPALAFVFIFKTLAAFVEVSFSVLLYVLVDSSSSKKDDLNRIYIIGAIGFGLFICCILFGFLNKYYTAKYMDEMDRLYKTDIAKNILRSDFETFNRHSTGEYIDIIQNDADRVSYWHFQGFFDLISASITLVIALAYSFYLSYIVTLIIISLSSIIVLGPFLTLPKTNKLNNIRSLASISFAKTAENMIDGSQVIKNCNADARAERLIDIKGLELRKASNDFSRFYAFSDRIMNTVALLLQPAIVFTACLLFMLGKQSWHQ